MASLRSIASQEVNHTEKLANLCRPQGSGDEYAVLEETHVQLIAEEMAAVGLRASYVQRPRLYYLLSNINRIAVMDIFIAHGHNDTHIPYRKQTLPQIDRPLFTYDERDQFLKQQKSCESKLLQLEKGVCCNLPDGDLLFEPRKRRLGHGSQGLTKVDEVTSLKTQIKYARKRIARKSYEGEAGKAFERELRNLVKTKIEDNDHLIQVQVAYTDRKYFALLLQPVADYNLRDYLSSRYHGTDAQKTILSSYFGCMANVMSFLHEKVKILHKDVKAENFLIKNNRIILTDFGTSFDWSATNQSSTGSNRGDPFTKRYASPEVAKESDFHRASDIWSLGVVFLEMTTVLRARTLQEFDIFMSQNHSRATHIYANLAGALAWIEELKNQSGHPSENEPLFWAQSMLELRMSDRPSASQLYEMALSSRDLKYCGRCCLDEASDASSFSGRTDNDEEGPTHQSVRLETSNGPSHRQMLPSMPHQKVEAAFYDKPVFAKGAGTTSIMAYGNPQIQESGRPQQVPRRDDHNVPAPQNSTVTKREESPKHTAKEAATRPTDRTSKMKQLALLKNRAQTEQHAKPQQLATILPDVQSQRMAHFLRSLPRCFDDVPESHADDACDALKPPKSTGSRLSLGTGTPSLDHLFILPQVPGDFKPVLQKQDRFEGRMIRYPSEGHLRGSYEAPASSRTELLMDLRKFSESLCLPKADNDSAGSTHTAIHGTTIKAEHEPPEPPKKQNHWSGWNKVNNHDSSGGPLIASWASHPLVTGRPNYSSTVKEEDAPRVEKLDSFLSNIINQQPSHEPASVIIERVLEEKKSLAQTSAMSFSTVKLLSGNRAVMKWNDEMYGYLPFFTGQGKVAAVKRLVADGCNPGLQSSLLTSASLENPASRRR